MGILTYLKLGAIGLIIVAAGYFYWNYNHMQAKIAILETQNAEQKKSIAWYEKAAGIDKETADVHQEIQQAAGNNDTTRMLELYKRLRDHQRSGAGQAPAPADHGPDRSRDAGDNDEGVDDGG